MFYYAKVDGVIESIHSVSNEGKEDLLYNVTVTGYNSMTQADCDCKLFRCKSKINDVLVVGDKVTVRIGDSSMNGKFYPGCKHITAKISGGPTSN